ncbi:MAG: hypothetical protein ACLFP4_02010 [Spirochaetales bacterium]
MEWLVLTLLAIIIGLLIYTIIKLGKSDFSFLANRMAEKSRDNFEVLRPCPLCKTMLRRGETIHSVVFSGDGRGTGKAAELSAGSLGSQGRPKEALAHMFGCKYCYPANPAHKRICPVCGETISVEGYVVARFFERPDKKHIHVLGCTECREQRRNTRGGLRT